MDNAEDIPRPLHWGYELHLCPQIWGQHQDSSTSVLTSPCAPLWRSTYPHSEGFRFTMQWLNAGRIKSCSLLLAPDNYTDESKRKAQRATHMLLTAAKMETLSWYVCNCFLKITLSPPSYLHTQYPAILTLKSTESSWDLDLLWMTESSVMRKLTSGR